MNGNGCMAPKTVEPSSSSRIPFLSHKMGGLCPALTSTILFRASPKITPKKTMVDVAGHLQFLPKSFLLQLLPRQLFVFNGYDNDIAQRLNELNAFVIVV